MSAEAVVFYVLAAITVGAAAVVVLARSLIYSAFALLFTFFGVAGLYVLLGADFLAATQLLIYVGGILGVLTRRNAVNVLMGIELILNSANLNLVAFSRFGAGNMQGQLFAVFVIVIAAAEVAVALAIVLTLYRLRRTPNLDEADFLRG